MIRMPMSAHLSVAVKVDRTAQKENSMPAENDFENKRVVIVGGTSGIGLAVAKEAASQGAKVVIVSSKAERVQEAIRAIGAEAQGQVVDVSKERAVESFLTTRDT
jgi:NADP-dependent 3-hydroxy acid dehydrogenase YdfG